MINLSSDLKWALVTVAAAVGAYTLKHFVLDGKQDKQQKTADELLRTQKYVHELDGGYCQNWLFEARGRLGRTDVIGMISHPSSDMINRFGYEYPKDMQPEAYVVLMLLPKDEPLKVLDWALVNYDEINIHLEEKLRSDGMLMVKFPEDATAEAQ